MVPTKVHECSFLILSFSNCLNRLNFPTSNFYVQDESFDLFFGRSYGLVFDRGLRSLGFSQSDSARVPGGDATAVGHRREVALLREGGLHQRVGEIIKVLMEGGVIKDNRLQVIDYR